MYMHVDVCVVVWERVAGLFGLVPGPGRAGRTRMTCTICKAGKFIKILVPAIRALCVCIPIILQLLNLFMLL